MLVLDRKADEGVWIGEHIFVKILDIRPQRVKLGIRAASDLDVSRDELGGPAHGKATTGRAQDGAKKGASAQRERLREALHRSESENRALLDAIPDMMFRFSGEGRFLDFIPAKGQKPAVPPARFLGRTLQEVFPADVALGAMAYIERALQTGDAQISEFRLPVPLPDGDVRDYEARVVATGRDEVLAIVREITERKQAEKALRESEAKYRGIFEDVRDVFYRTDMNGVFTEVSPSVERWGYDAEKLIGSPVRDIYEHPEERPVFLNTVLEQGRAIDYEVRLKTGDGRVMDASVSCHVLRDQDGAVVGIEGIARDITERKRTEKTLRETQEHLHAVVSNAPIILWAMDREGVCTLSEGRGLEALGLKPGQVVGQSVFDLYADEPHVLEGDRRALAGEELRSVVELGGVVFDSSHHPVRDEKGEVIQVIGVATNITEGKRAEDMLRVERDLAVALNAAADLDETLRLSLEAAICVSGLDCGCVYLADGSSGAFDLACHEGLGSEFLRSVTRYEAHSDNARYVMTGRPLYTRHQEMGIPIDEPRRREGLRAVAVVPVHHEDAVIACLCVMSHSLDDVPPASRNALETIAAQVGGAIAHSRAQEALRESGELMRTLITSAPITLFAIDREGVFTVAAGRGTKPEGLIPGKHVGRSVFDVYSHMPEVTDAARRALAGEAFSATQEAEGMVFDAQLAPLRDSEGTITGAVAVATNVTDRQRAEEAAKESEAKWRSLVENAPALIMTLDRDGTIQFANHGVTGAPLEEAIGSSIFRYAPPQYHDDMREVFARVFETGEIGGDFDVPWLESDGSTSWHIARVGPLKQDGEVAALTIIATDVTERRRAEEALREREQRLRTIIENAPVGLFAIDQEGVITLSEGRAQQAMGLKRGEHVGLPLVDVYRDYPGIVEGTPRVLAGEAMTAAIRVGRVLLEVRTTPVRDQDGKVTGAIGVATDITERDRAEKARRESEEHLRTVVTNAPVILFAIDSEGVFTVAEGRGMTPVGLRPAEHVGHSIFDVYRNLPGVIDAARRALTGEAFAETVETENRVFEAHVTPIRDRGGMITGAVAVATDVTERHRAEEALRHREYVLREVQGIAHVGSWEIDLVTGQETLSDEMYAIYGIGKDADTRIESIMALVHPDDEEAARQAAEDAIEGNPPSVEYRIVRPDGEMRTVYTEGARIIRDEAGRPVRLIGSTQDITYRKEAEHALHESEERFRRLAEATLEGIVIHDGNVVLDANEQAAAILGGEAADVVGGDPLSFVAPESRDLVRQHILAGYEEAYEVLGLRRDGTTFPMEVRGSAISYKGRQVRVGAMRDITERRQAEEVLQRGREELEERVERQMERGGAHGLSFRELTVLHLVVTGRADKEIATDLGISPRTASKHVENILEKMGAASRTEASVRAVQEGLVGQPD